MGLLGIAGGVMLCLSLAVTRGSEAGAVEEEAVSGNVTMATGYSCVENGSWISGERVCDGVRDCGRLGDDESFCLETPQPTPCIDLLENAPVFNCLNTTNSCLPHSYFCDDFVDCDSEEDELNCDRQYVPECSFGVLQVTCINVTLNVSLDRNIPNNIRFIYLDGVRPPNDEEPTVHSLINLSSVPYLVKIYLVNNNLTELRLGEPDSLYYLRFLHVSHNRIRTVTSHSFLAAPNLVRLEMPNNQIVYIEAGAFRGMTSLTDLDIMGNKIQTLHPDTFSALSRSLEIIDMSHNEILDLELGVFQHLRNVLHLYLSHNRIKTLKNGTFLGLSKLTSLNLSHNNMRTLKKGTFLGLSKLTSLEIKNVPIRHIEQGAMDGLAELHLLDLWYNALEFISPGTFQELSSLQVLTIIGSSISSLQNGSFAGLHNLIHLILANNSISKVEPGAFQGLENVMSLDLGNNSFRELQANTFAGLPQLQILWMSHVPLRHIEPGAFAGLSNVRSLNILHADIEAPSLGMLDGLDNLTTLSTRDHLLCCLLDPARNISCVGPTEAFSSCQRLMPNTVLRVAIWLLGISAILGNIFVICQRAVKKGWRELTVQSILITHLAVSDALMGAYMIAIGAADLHFGQSYFLSAKAWRTGGWCRAIGFLSMLSSEASVFLVMLISVDRFVSIAFPFSRFRLEPRFACITVAVFWVIAFALSLVGTIMAQSMPSFFGLSDVCVGLPLITTAVNQSSTWTYSRATGTYAFETSAASTKPAWAFSVFLYLGLNFACFIVVLVCYVLIFIIVRRSSRSVTRRGKMAGNPCNGTYGGASSRSITFTREVKLASRMALVVGTDFLCWMPIIIMGMLTQSGAVSVPDELYAWTVVFILPINSSLNPYLYTVSEVCSKQRKRSKKAAQCVRMTYTLPRLTDNDRILNSAVDSDTVAGFIGRGS